MSCRTATTRLIFCKGVSKNPKFLLSGCLYIFIVYLLSKLQSGLFGTVWNLIAVRQFYKFSKSALFFRLPFEGSTQYQWNVVLFNFCVTRWTCACAFCKGEKTGWYLNGSNNKKTQTQKKEKKERNFGCLEKREGFCSRRPALSLNRSSPSFPDRVL